MLIFSAIIFAQDMPREALNAGTPIIFASMLTFNAVILIIIGLLNLLDRIKFPQMSWVSLVMVFAILAVPTLFIKDNVDNEGPSIAFILLFAGAFLPLIFSAIRSVVASQVETKAVKRQLFDDETAN